MVGQMPLVRSDAIAWSTWKRKGGLVNAILQDAHAPEFAWETIWSKVRPVLLEHCQSGKVVVFCKGGLGRTGLYAAILLQELGMSALSSVEMVRKVRPDTIETERQLEYVLNYGLIRHNLGGQ